jgi:glucose/mannose-6-phosphate isomerase
MNISSLEKYDSQKMYKVYDNWPEIANDAFEAKQELVHFDNIDHIVFAGMGGSGAVGDIIASILSKSDIHISHIKGYLLPKTVNKNTLVIVTSVSGNTIESLTILDSARKMDCKLIAFSSGGKLEKMCNEYHILFRKIPFFHSPRTSLVNFTYSILNILNSIFPIEKKEINDSINQLKNIKNQIDSNNLTDSNPAMNLANWITGIPVIYYPHGLQSVATRFKSALQENAKTHAIIEDVIETCHNGIVSWEKSSIVQPILIRGEDDYVKTKERFEIIKEFFQKNNIDYKEIHSNKGNILTKIISLMYMLDYTTIYNAVISKVDPSPVSSIDYIKNRLK